MSSLYLDTHVAVWLHDGLVEKLTDAAKDAIETSQLLLSPMVYLELGYLFRRGRVSLPAAEIYANLSTTFGVSLCNQAFPVIAAAAVGLEWTNDPFDRIIVAQALSDPRSRLATADETIRAHFDRAVW